MNFRDNSFTKINQYLTERMKSKYEDYLREFSEDGFLITNSDASDYVSRGRDLDFFRLANLIYVVNEI